MSFSVSLKIEKLSRTFFGPESSFICLMLVVTSAPTFRSKFLTHLGIHMHYVLYIVRLLAPGPLSHNGDLVSID